MIRRIHDPGGSVMRSRTSSALADPLALAPLVAQEAASAGTKTHPAPDQTRKGRDRFNSQEATARTRCVHLRKGAF